jgi:hypothetical protein
MKDDIRYMRRFLKIQRKKGMDPRALKVVEDASKAKTPADLKRCYYTIRKVVQEIIEPYVRERGDFRVNMPDRGESFAYIEHIVTVLWDYQ